MSAPVVTREFILFARISGRFSVERKRQTPANT